MFMLTNILIDYVLRNGNIIVMQLVKRYLLTTFFTPNIYSANRSISIR